MNFIGRKKELFEINKAFKSDVKEFIAITGKRGIGKTELSTYAINNFCLKLEKNNEILKQKKEIKVFKLRGRNKTSTLDQILDAEIYFNDFFSLKEQKHFTRWSSFFNALENEINKLNEETIFIFYIDEFPWLNTKGSNFVEDFGVFWNSVNFNKKIKVIITGSAVSWLNKNVFRSKGGLYHKTTLKIQLKAFDVLEVKEFLNLKKNVVTTNDVLSYYMITGGIARYLNQLDFSLPIYENGFNLHSNNDILDFFNNSFSLKNNIHYLIISLFKERIKLNIMDIKKSTLLKNFSPNTIYSALDELVETDILLKVNERKKTNSPSYVLCDSFLFFSLRNKDDGKKTMPNLFLNQNRFNIVNGFAFEILVLNNIHLILKELGLYSKIQKNQNYELIKYNNFDSQIDLIIDHKTNFYSLVECKFYNDVYVLERQEENKIYNRFDQISKNNKFSNKKTQINIILCTAFGSINKGNLIYNDVNFQSILELES